MAKRHDAMEQPICFETRKPKPHEAATMNSLSDLSGNVERMCFVQLQACTSMYDAMQTVALWRSMSRHMDEIAKLATR